MIDSLMGDDNVKQETSSSVETTILKLRSSIKLKYIAACFQ